MGIVSILKLVISNPPIENASIIKHITQNMKVIDKKYFVKVNLQMHEV